MAIPPPFAPAGSRLTGPTSPGAGWRGIGGGWWAPPRPGAGIAATPPATGSIISQALAGHPNWAGAPAAPAAPAAPQTPTPGPTPNVPQPGLGAVINTPAGSWSLGDINTALGGVASGQPNTKIQPTVPQPPGSPLASPAAPAAPPKAPPRDSTYYQNVADNQARIGNQINALNLQGTQDQTALQTALAALAYQQPRDQLAAEQAANRGGGLYSSVENLNQANLAHAYATRIDAANTTYSNEISRLAAQIAGLQGGETQYEHEQQTASGQRAATLAANAPAPAAPAAPAVPKVPAAPTPPKNAPAGSRHTGPTPPGPRWRGLGGGWWAPPLTGVAAAGSALTSGAQLLTGKKK